jgi:ABC-type branched-subunit amino acid transport system ATPase component
MNEQRPLGLYLFSKSDQNVKVLKELLQFLRSNSPGKSSSFSYIEAETSLHPHLSLWENLQIELGTRNWNEFRHTLKPEWISLVNLLKQPELQTNHAQTWEKFLVSLLKGLMMPTQNLLIDMNEDLLSPFLIQLFKKSMLEATKEKNVYLATANSSVWLECAHSIVERKDYKFEIRSLDVDPVKKSWAA